MPAPRSSTRPTTVRRAAAQACSPCVLECPVSSASCVTPRFGHDVAGHGGASPEQGLLSGSADSGATHQIDGSRVRRAPGRRTDRQHRTHIAALYLRCSGRQAARQPWARISGTPSSPPLLTHDDRTIVDHAPTGRSPAWPKTPAEPFDGCAIGALRRSVPISWTRPSGPRSGSRRWPTVELIGLEPTTSCMPCKRSSKLSYSPVRAPRRRPHQRYQFALGALPALLASGPTRSRCRRVPRPSTWRPLPRPRPPR